MQYYEKHVISKIIDSIKCFKGLTHLKWFWKNETSVVINQSIISLAHPKTFLHYLIIRTPILSWIDPKSYLKWIPFNWIKSNKLIDLWYDHFANSGESGAGKTENTKKVIAYFANVGASTPKDGQKKDSKKVLKPLKESHIKLVFHLFPKSQIHTVLFE